MVLWNDKVLTNSCSTLYFTLSEVFYLSSRDCGISFCPRSLAEVFRWQEFRVQCNCRDRDLGNWTSQHSHINTSTFLNRIQRLAEILLTGLKWRDPLEGWKTVLASTLSQGIDRSPGMCLAVRQKRPIQRLTPCQRTLMRLASLFTVTKKSDEKKMKTIVFLGSLFYLVSNSDAKTFKMGTLVPFSGSWRGGPKMASAILIAMDKVNNDPYWLQGHNLSYVMKDSRCEAEASIISVIDLYTLEDPIVDVYIGPGCSTGCLPSAFIAAHWNIPMISWGCSATDLSDKATYPYFVRTTGTFTGAGDLMRALMERYNWKRLGIMATTDIFFSGTANRAKVKLEEDGKFLVPFFGSFDPGSTDRNKLKSMVISMASKARGGCHNFLSQQDTDRSATRARSSRILIKTDSVQSSSNTCKNYLLKIYSQHGNFLNAI